MLAKPGRIVLHGLLHPVRFCGSFFSSSSFPHLQIEELRWRHLLRLHIGDRKLLLFPVVVVVAVVASLIVAFPVAVSVVAFDALLLLTLFLFLFLQLIFLF